MNKLLLKNYIELLFETYSYTTDGTGNPYHRILIGAGSMIEQEKLEEEEAELEAKKANPNRRLTPKTP